MLYPRAGDQSISYKTEEFDSSVFFFEKSTIILIKVIKNVS